VGGELMYVTRATLTYIPNTVLSSIFHIPYKYGRRDGPSMPNEVLSSMYRFNNKKEYD
jgi:hypothetical protein